MSQPLPAPRLAEAYEVLEVVRRGGLTTTLRARHRGSGELRCIDVLRPAPGSAEELERRLDAEARPLMELRHPHVVRLVDAAVGTCGEACLVREDQEGVTLRRLTGERRASVALAVEILRQAADALSYLHGRGRCVAGLAPEGLLLGADESMRPRLLLADLGLAKDWQEEAALTAAGLFVGRLRYTPPEQFEASGRQSAPGDVYALGLVAYELLTGQHPVQGESASSLIAGHLFRPATDFAETDPEGRVPEPLRRLVLSALAKVPDERPSADELASDLEQLGADLPPWDDAELAHWIGVRPTAAGPATHLAGTATQVLSSMAPGGPDEETLQEWLDEARALARDEQFVESRDIVRKVLRAQPDHSDGLMLLASVEACLKIQMEESKSHETTRAAPTPDSASGFTATVPMDAGGPASEAPIDAPTEASPAETSRIRTIGAGGEGMNTLRIDPDQIPQGPEPDEMETMRLDPSAIEPPPAVGSQARGAPGSTDRLDVPEGGLDLERTRPLSPSMLDRFGPGADGPSEPERAEVEVEDLMESGKTLPLDSSPDVPPPAIEPPPDSVVGPLAETTEPGRPQPLPGTVTMPIEQIREARAEPAPQQTSQNEREPVPEPEREPEPAPTPRPDLEREPASVDDMGFGGTEPAPFVDRDPRRGRRGKSQRQRPRRGDPGRKKGGNVGILMGAAVAAVLVFAIGYAVAAGVDLKALLGLAGDSEVVVPPSEIPVAVDPGWLVLDAEPWAEIVQITNELGEDVPLRIRHTPARYELPPGVYTVVLSASGSDPETFELDVTTGEVTQVRPELRSLDAEDYFALMGWR